MIVSQNKKRDHSAAGKASTGNMNLSNSMIISKPKVYLTPHIEYHELTTRPNTSEPKHPIRSTMSLPPLVPQKPSKRIEVFMPTTDNFYETKDSLVLTKTLKFSEQKK